MTSPTQSGPTEAELRLAMDAIPALVWSATPEGAADFVNKAWVEYTNLSLEASRGFGWSAAIHADDRPAYVARWQTAVCTREPFEGEARIRAADGQYRCFLCRATPLRDRSGNTIKWYGQLTDIEDRKRAETRTEQAETELRLAIGAIPAVVWIGAPDGACLFVNKGWVEYTGQSLEDTLGLGYSVPLHPDDRPGFVDRFLKAVAIGEPYEDETRIRRFDGQYRWFLVRAMPVRDGNGKVIKWYGTNTDIEDRKRAEIERHEAGLESARLASIVASSDDAIISKDLDGRITSWNAAAMRIFGYPTYEMIGQPITRIIPAELFAEEEEIFAKLKRGEPTYYYETVRIADGGRRLDMSVTESLLREKSGSVIGSSIIARDITERKQAERLNLLALKAELARVARLTTMGELTASIAHEIAQPLLAIVTNGATCLHWLEDETFNPAKARAAATRAVRDAERADGIIRRIRALMTKSGMQKTEIHLNEIIGEALALIEYELRSRHVSVSTNLTSTLPSTVGDRVQLQQLMLNLVLNSVEAMASVSGRRKELMIETRMGAPDQILTSVRDSGEGIGSEQIECIFDAFFTTKSEGTGMGLAICRSIVEAHDGRIWASPGIPHGAVLQFTLPARTVVTT